MPDQGGSSLDRIARDLASGEVSRRSALKRLAGLGLGIGAAVTPVASALAADCPAGRVKCDGKCCPTNARCKNGRCKCKPGYKKCGRKCVNTDTSIKHCGGCDSPCAEGEPCVDGTCGECTPDDTQPCYTGPPGTENVGICEGGTQTCDQNGQWGSCVGEVTPQEEICGNGEDDNCNGTVDDGCVTCETPFDCPGSDGTCGQRTCEAGYCGFTFADAGTVCVGGICSGTYRQAASTCDGAGTCVPGASANCSPYVCMNATTCYSSCDGPAQCFSPATCQNGVCTFAPPP